MDMQVDKFRRSVLMIAERKTPYNSTFAIGGGVLRRQFCC